MMEIRNKSPTRYTAVANTMACDAEGRNRHGSFSAVPRSG
jgi:hypothetical protein